MPKRGGGTRKQRRSEQLGGRQLLESAQTNFKSKRCEKKRKKQNQKNKLMREMKKANDDYVKNKKKPFRIGLEECKPGTQIIFKGTRQILNGTILQAKYNILFVELEENKAAEAEGLLNSDTNGNVLLKIPKDNVIEIRRRRKERTGFIVSPTSKK